MHKRILSGLLIALVTMATGGPGARVSEAAQPDGVVPDQYIVVLNDSIGSPEQVANEMAERHGASVGHIYSYALKGFAARIPAERLAAVRGDNRVLFISQDREVWAFAQTLPTGVDRIQGDASTTASGNGSGSVNVAVAIIDTGSGPHADLNVVGGKNCSTGISFNDGNGHGTHVAGTVGAKDDTAVVVGVAPSVPIYSVRVLNNAGSGSWSSVICGIDWVTGNAASTGIKVANLSLGGSGSDDGNCGNSNKDALHKAICRSVTGGVTYVVAAGNSSADLATFVPAAYNEVVTVTAMADFNGQPGGGGTPTCRSDVDDTGADFSNFTTIGSADESHTIAAPGVCITSTWKGGGYHTISGTSMASPHIAGAAALCIAGPCAVLTTPSQVVAKLRADAASQPASYGFFDDPNSPNVKGYYYGYLGYAGGY